MSVIFISREYQLTLIAKFNLRQTPQNINILFYFIHAVVDTHDNAFSYHLVRIWYALKKYTVN